MAKLNIYLTRHGQDEDNAKGILNGHRDKPLTRLGVDQAKELGKKIKKTGIEFEKVYCSPLQRAFKTAKIITKCLEIEKPKVLDVLIERDMGVMAGQPISKIMEMCAPNVIETEKIIYCLGAKGAETFLQMVMRARKLLDYLRENYKDGNILLVSHGDFGKMIFADYYGLSWKKVLTMFHFGNSELLLLSDDCRPEKARIIKSKQYNK